MRRRTSGSCASAATSTSKPFFSTSRPIARTVRPCGSGAPRSNAVTSTPMTILWRFASGTASAQVRHVVVAAGEDRVGAGELLAQVARREEDVVGVRGDAEGASGERGEAHRVERRPGREVRVQVLVAALDDPPRCGGQRAQRPRPLLARPAAPAHGVARARQRAAPQEPEQVTHAAGARVAGEEVDVDVVGRLRVGVRRGLGGLDTHVVAEPAQRLQLVDDERLRQLRPLVKDEQQPHVRPTVERAARDRRRWTPPIWLGNGRGWGISPSAAVSRWR